MEEDVITEVAIVGNELQLLREKAQIDVQVSTAKAFPRDIQRSLSNALFTATMDFETADTCTYALPRGGKVISGPSVNLAKILMQCWGNMRSEAKVVDETPRHVVSEAFAWDLENNVAVKVTVKRSIMQNKGKTRMNEDMITVTGNAANSIALRNALFAVLPKSITDKVYSAVQVKIIGGELKFDERLAKVLAGFKKTYQKDTAEVLALVSRVSVDDVTPNDLAVLIGVATSLKEGDITPELLFKEEPKSGAEKKADLKAKQAEAKNTETKAGTEEAETQTEKSELSEKTESPAAEQTEQPSGNVISGQGQIKLP